MFLLYTRRAAWKSRAASKSAGAGGPCARLQRGATVPIRGLPPSTSCSLVLRREPMPFVPSTGPWMVASPLGAVVVLKDPAAVKALATGPLVGLRRVSNFNVMLGSAPSNRKDGCPTAHCEHWTWVDARSSLQWIQFDGSNSYVPILGGTAAWFMERFANRRADLRSIGEQNLRKLLGGNLYSNGQKATGIGNGERKWRVVDCPDDPVQHVHHFISSLDAAGAHSIGI